jgi:hypothetical protein
MSAFSARLAVLFSLVAACTAGASLWYARQAETAIRVSSALAVRPILVIQADARPGAGLRISNQGVGPAVVADVRMALPAADGSMDWLAYPDAVNGSEMNLWAFIGLPQINAGLPEGQAVTATPPQPGSIFPVGEGLDLLRFPAGNLLPEEWKAANLARAEAALQGLMVCLTYSGLDGSLYQLDRGGLCARQPEARDRRYTGK